MKCSAFSVSTLSLTIRNWFGFLGVFKLRRHVTDSEDDSRIYYRITYTESQVGCCPVSLLFYLDEQVKLLNVRMNCVQRVSVIDRGGPQVQWCIMYLILIVVVVVVVVVVVGLVV